MSKIRLCPKCRKPTLKNATNVSGWLAPSMYECTDEKCKYIGYLYIEVDPTDYDLKTDEENNKMQK